MDADEKHATSYRQGLIIPTHRLPAERAGSFGPTSWSRASPRVETLAAHEVSTRIQPQALDIAVAYFAELKRRIHVAVEIVLLLCNLAMDKIGLGAEEKKEEKGSKSSKRSRRRRKLRNSRGAYSHIHTNNHTNNHT